MRSPDQRHCRSRSGGRSTSTGSFVRLSATISHKSPSSLLRGGSLQNPVTFTSPPGVGSSPSTPAAGAAETEPLIRGAFYTNPRLSCHLFSCHNLSLTRLYCDISDRENAPFHFIG